jgi:gamma-glutamyltranspeptidase
MAIAPNEVIEIAVLGRLSGSDDIVNVYQVQHTSGSSITEDDFLNDWIALFRALYDAIKAIFTAAVVWQKIRARSVTNPGVLIGERNFSSDVVGTAGGTMSPTNAALISLKSNIARVVPRKYLPIASGSYDADGDIVAGTITLLNTFGSALITPQTGLSTHTYRFGYFSPKTNTFVVPLSRVVTPTVVTQRRRRKGVGS